MTKLSAATDARPAGDAAATENAETRRVSRGFGTVLVAVYGVLALAAIGRSIFQIATKFPEAPLAYTLSAVAALVYLLATVSLLLPGRAWRRLAWITISFELAGVLLIGSISLIAQDLFPHDTVWSAYGRGYLFIPLLLPLAGLWWLIVSRTRGARS